MSKQVLFKRNEILDLGLRKVNDGGYHYYCVLFNPSDPIGSDGLITNDMMSGLKNPLFHVEKIQKKGSIDAGRPLNRDEIDYYRRMFKLDGKA